MPSALTSLRTDRRYTNSKIIINEIKALTPVSAFLMYYMLKYFIEYKGIKDENMLELKNIVKDYSTGNNVVHALKGIDLKFRKNEFVAILGQSGCGKTTMLNIIGGLDHATDGDLVINGVSTKKYKDKDWDAYRNHSIGFVFQNYNLIPHQTVFQNVEITLTLSGISKSERRERTLKVLEAVGLSDQIKKKPSELSGGQMQRVAIARAIVNNPDIILADEPTGALDSETSIQVMDILKEIAKDHLVIMVTHNPELADRYASRIIKMLDGEIKSDSNPVNDEEIKSEEKFVNKKLKGMSLLTSLNLSLRNLFTKKGRMILTSFAGSIGIVGIGLILAISKGTTRYINEVQADALISYPITIDKQSVDLTDMMMAYIDEDTGEVTHDDMDHVYEKDSLFSMTEQLSGPVSYDNNLTLFKEYLEDELENGDGRLKKALTGYRYSYYMDFDVYTKNVDGNIQSTDIKDIVNDIIAGGYGGNNEEEEIFSDYSDMISGFSLGSTDIWTEIMPGMNNEPVNPVITDQYELLAGSWPEDMDEMVFVTDENNEVDAVTLYALGLISEDDIFRSDNSWSFDEIIGREYRLVINSYYDEDDPDNKPNPEDLYDNGLALKITGVIKPKPDNDNALLSGTLAYTSGLTEYIAENDKESELSSISLYVSTFENKDTVEEIINEYNEAQDDDEKIKYTDMSGLIMSSVEGVVNAVANILIAFVAVSLIVSSIMIGVITLISVQERTREIGILRAAGASKKDVSGLFNAETAIIGFTSGLIGVGITVLLCVPINYVMHLVTEIDSLSVYLPVKTGVILVTVSVLLTLIAGVIPSKSAARKDPVEALRSE